MRTDDAGPESESLIEHLKSTTTGLTPRLAGMLLVQGGGFAVWLVASFAPGGDVPAWLVPTAWLVASVCLAGSMMTLARWFFSRIRWMGASILLLVAASLILGFTADPAGVKLSRMGPAVDIDSLEALIGPLQYLAALGWLIGGFLLAEWLYQSRRPAVRWAGILGWVLLIVYVTGFGALYVRQDSEMFRLLLLAPIPVAGMLAAVGVAAFIRE